MGVHGDDIVRTIRDALADERYSAQAPTQSGVRIEPNPAAGGWQRRDGKLVFDCVGRDWFRVFRVTVEVLPSLNDFEGEMGDKDWRVA